MGIDKIKSLTCLNVMNTFAIEFVDVWMWKLEMVQMRQGMSVMAMG